MHQSLTRQLGYLAVGVVLALALTVGFATLAQADTATSTGTTTTSYVFDAALSPSNEVPAITTTTSTSTSGGTATTTATTTGQTRVWFDSTNASGTATTTTNMWYKVTLQNGDDIFGAHLHCGTPGTNGPVVVDLFNVATTSAVDVNGTLVGTSSITNGMVHGTTTGCAMPITNLNDLAAAMKAGMIYSNVHSVAFPNGVARGQMTLTSQMSTSTSSGCMLSGNGSATSGWYDGNHVWHSCDGNGGNGGNNCVGAASTSLGWYDVHGNWHACNGNGGNGGSGGSTTPPINIPGIGGLGSSINGLLSKIFGQVNHILETFIPADTNVPALRTERTR